MNSEEFRKRGFEMVNYIADYMDTVKERRVLPEVGVYFILTRIVLYIGDN